MFSDIPKENITSEKAGTWAEKFNAAKTALFNQSDEQDYDFTKHLLRDAPRLNEEESATADTIQQDDALKSLKPDERTAFLRNRVRERMLSNWEHDIDNAPQSDFTERLSEEELAEARPYTPPLLIGFDDENNYVELEYMVVANPVTGKSIAPEVTIQPSEDGQSGDIYLNGKIAASVAGAQNMDPSSIRLVKVHV